MTPKSMDHQEIIGLEIQPSSCTIELHLYVVMQIKMPYYNSILASFSGTPGQARVPQKDPP